MAVFFVNSLTDNISKYLHSILKIEICFLHYFDFNKKEIIVLFS
ncbi:Uncharacterised protein [Staphylococcus simiae]|nr:Uncharacterised protein [Staphylococcus simiae]